MVCSYCYFLHFTNKYAPLAQTCSALCGICGQTGHTCEFFAIDRFMRLTIHSFRLEMQKQREYCPNPNIIIVPLTSIYPQITDFYTISFITFPTVHGNGILPCHSPLILPTPLLEAICHQMRYFSCSLIPVWPKLMEHPP